MPALRRHFAEQAIDAGAADAEPPGDRGPPKLLLVAQPLLLPGHLRLPTRIDPTRLGRGDTLELALASQVCFEFGEESKHVSTRLLRRHEHADP
jgi:hypothetical protein